MAAVRSAAGRGSTRGSPVVVDVPRVGWPSTQAWTQSSPLTTTCSSIVTFVPYSACVSTRELRPSFCFRVIEETHSRGLAGLARPRRRSPDGWCPALPTMSRRTHRHIRRRWTHLRGEGCSVLGGRRRRRGPDDRCGQGQRHHDRAQPAFHASSSRGSTVTWLSTLDVARLPSATASCSRAVHHMVSAGAKLCNPRRPRRRAPYRCGERDDGASTPCHRTVFDRRWHQPPSGSWPGVTDPADHDV